MSHVSASDVTTMVTGHEPSASVGQRPLIEHLSPPHQQRFTLAEGALKSHSHVLDFFILPCKGKGFGLCPLLLPSAQGPGEVWGQVPNGCQGFFSHREGLFTPPKAPDFPACDLPRGRCRGQGHGPCVPGMTVGHCHTSEEDVQLCPSPALQDEEGPHGQGGPSDAEAERDHFHRVPCQGQCGAGGSRSCCSRGARRGCGAGLWRQRVPVPHVLPCAGEILSGDRSGGC